MHIMIDLETMGTRPDAPIIAIGAVKFTAAGVCDDFYEVVDLGSAVRSGSTMSPDTVLWWLKQSDAARAAFDRKGSSLVGALGNFSRWVGSSESIVGVWGNGATFDNVILSEAYERLELSRPWPFWKDSCYRTIKNMFNDVPIYRDGTHHNAVDDARTQANHLIAISAAHGSFL